MVAAAPETKQRTYHFRATIAPGRAVVDAIDADSMPDAVRLLKNNGFSDIHILSTELEVLAPSSLPPGVRPISPARLARLREFPISAAARFHDVWLTYRAFGLFPWLGLAGMVVSRLLFLPLFFDILAAIFVVWPLLVWLNARNRSSAHRRFERAILDADFEKALALIPRFEAQSKRTTSEEFLRYAVLEKKTWCLARLDRTAEALALIDEFENTSTSSDALSQALRVTALVNARLWQQALEAARELDRRDPGSALGKLTQAEVLANGLGRPTEARVALEAARAIPKSDTLQHFFDAAEGAVLFAERRFPDARKRLEGVLPYFRAQVYGSPTLALTVSFIETVLAISCARVSDMPAARRHWNAARPLMERHKVEPWVSNARLALGD